MTWIKITDRPPPRDGSEILLYFPGNDSTPEIIDFCYWDDEHNHFVCANEGGDPKVAQRLAKLSQLGDFFENRIWDCVRDYGHRPGYDTFKEIVDWKTDQIEQDLIYAHHVILKGSAIWRCFDLYTHWMSPGRPG